MSDSLLPELLAKRAELRELWQKVQQLERENAALRAELELARFFGRVAERTLNAARKEAQP